MTLRCPLCDQAMQADAPSAEVADQTPTICPDCTALPAEERKALRDRAMTRMLRQGRE